MPEAKRRSSSEIRIDRYLDRVKDVIDDRSTLTPDEERSALLEIKEYIDNVSLPDAEYAPRNPRKRR